MPYFARKEGDQYCVYKKDGGKKMGCTKGNKESLKKYMAALHMHELKETIQDMKPIKLASLINLKESEQKVKMTSEEKKAFLEAVNRFAEHSSNIYRNHNILETSRFLGELIEAASHLTLSETEDWFDANTVNRHMKHLGEAHKIFEKTASEMNTLQQRLESAYEDIGETLSKYYDVNGMVNEANELANSGQDYQKFFQKAMKRFKINSPADFANEKMKKKFFNWVDANYVSADETSKDDKKEE
jgi:hypothetical protein